MSNRPAVHFATGKQICDKMMANASKHHEGWSSVATWTFNLYFMQEKSNYEALCALLKRSKRRKPFSDDLYVSARKMMDEAYNGKRMEPFDGDEDGDVNVREIVDSLAAELFRTDG